MHDDHEQEKSRRFLSSSCSSSCSIAFPVGQTEDEYEHEHEHDEDEDGRTIPEEGRPGLNLRQE